MRAPWTVVVADREKPTPKRARNSVKALMARPERKVNTAKAAVANAMIGGRGKRSASQPIGKAPTTMNAVEAAVMKTIAPSLMPRLSRMSGASTPRVAPSKFSTMLITSSM